MSVGVKRVVLVDPNDENIINKTGNEYLPAILVKADKTVIIKADYHEGTSENKRGRANWIIKLFVREEQYTKDDKSNKVGDKMEVKIPAKLCGNYYLSIEAFLNRPENKPPTRIFIVGKAPQKIINITWSKTEKILDLGQTRIKYGDNIWVHIQSEGLNNMVVQVDVFNTDTKDDGAIYTKTGKLINGELKINFKNTFIWRKRTGWVTKDSGEKFYVEIRLKGKRTKILNDKTPTYLYIEDKITKRTIEESTTNLPLKTGNLEANVERYEPCRFASLTIVDEGNTIPLFDEGKLKLKGDKRTEFKMSVTINFDFNQFSIRASDKAKLKSIITFLNDSPYVPVEIGAHCDIKGKHKYNDDLSWDRAKSLKKYLVDKGVTLNRISHRGYGKRKLLIKGENLSPKQDEQNRRATIKLKIFKNNAESIIFNTIAQDKTKKKEIQLQVVDYKTVKCFKKGTEHEHDDKVYVVELTQDGKKGPYEYNGKTMVYSKTPKVITIWPTKAEPNLFKYYINSCRYYFNKKTPNVIVNVYPDIEWEIAFILTVGNSYSGTLKYEKKELKGYHKGFGFNYLKKDLAISTKKIGALSFSISGKYIVNGKEQESVIALKKISSSIEKAKLAYNKVSEYLEMFNPKKGKGKSAAVTKGVLALEFNIDPPNIALALGWKYGHGQNNKELIPIYKGGLKLDPLIGISIGVDLIPILGKSSPVGAIIGWIIKVIKYLSDSDIFIIFECFTAVKGEVSLSYNKIDGFDKKGEQHIEIEAGVSLKVGANSNDTVFVATSTRADVTDMVEVEEWKVEGKVATSFSFIEEVNYDRNNGKQYRQSSVVFNGAKLTITIYELITKKKLDYDAGYSNTFQLFNKEEIYKSEKSYLDGN